MKEGAFLVATLSLLGLCCTHVDAQLIIDPTFDSSITSSANASTIEAEIDQAISTLEGDISTPITVSIDFANENTGLAGSTVLQGATTYSQYHARLASHATSVNDALALATLPGQTNNPVNGDSMVELTFPLARALGFTASPSAGQFDGTVSLNLSRINLRTGTQNPSDFDLESLATHEIDEILGIGGYGSQLNFALSGNGNVTSGIPVGPLDLFRYSAPGVRSFSTSGAATSYFSINGGVTDLVNFNQGGSGSDYGDWATSASPQVQDAFATANVDINLGVNELTALDVIGYNLDTDAVPEPHIGYLLIAGLVALGIRRRVLRIETDKH